MCIYANTFLNVIIQNKLFIIVSSVVTQQNSDPVLLLTNFYFNIIMKHRGERKFEFFLLFSKIHIKTNTSAIIQFK